MKPRLPLSFSFLAASALAASITGQAPAAILHQDASIITYTDFAQNRGRYVAGATNALLASIREQEGGARITYTGGQEAYTLEYGVIDFSSTSDLAGSKTSTNVTAVGYTFAASVVHLGSSSSITFSARNIGSGNAIVYSRIENTKDSDYMLTAPADPRTQSSDYKISRLSKIITDITPATAYGSQDGDYSALYDGSLADEPVFRIGSGTSVVWNYESTGPDLAWPGTYTTAGVMKPSAYETIENGDLIMQFAMDSTAEGINSDTPLPYVVHGYDSGSPTYAWNSNTGQYEYLGPMQAVDYNAHISQSIGNSEWTAETMASFDVKLSTTETAYLNAVNADQRGSVSIGEEETEFTGVASGSNTWKDLSGLKDTDNWYAYDGSYLNLNYATLFDTQNLVFEAGRADNEIILNATVDLGIGYVRFSKEGALESASFTITSSALDTGGGYMLNSAGYIVDQGVSLRLQLTNPDDYMREWRKVGEGDLYIEGEGNNNILLNLGGSGSTFLERTDGYAAYNVLASSGATVVIKDIGQIQRDFTFGNMGGTLDMNGNSMEWNNDNDASATGFTIHALDEQAIIANRAEGTASTLTWTQGGSQTYLGSFQDTVSSALMFIYDGGSGSTLSLNGIFTRLQHEDSGLTVQSGTVKLEGTLTIHAQGSSDGTSSERLVRDNDWHYADATMNVCVRQGGTLELASHARLIGDVTVEEGGIFIMREGVQSRYEYIEGGETLEDTYAISDYYGLKGDVALKGGSSMLIAYSEGAMADTTYNGNITGEGELSVNLQTNDNRFISNGLISLTSVQVEKGRLVLGETGKTVVGNIAITAAKQENSYCDAFISSSETGASITGTEEAEAVFAGVEIEIAEKTTLTMEDALLKADSRISGTDSIVNMNGARIQLEEGLNLTLAALAEDVSPNEGKTLVMEVSALSGVTISGTALTLDFSGLDLDDWLNAGYSMGSLSFSDGTCFDAESAPVITAVFNGGETSTCFSIQGNNTIIYFNLVPEPATSVLCLASLSLLIARRRRR